MITLKDIVSGITLEAVQSLCSRVIGKRVSPETLFRWIHKQDSRGNLEAMKVAGEWHSTIQNFIKFLNARNKTDSPVTPPSLNELDEELKANGLL